MGYPGKQVRFTGKEAAFAASADRSSLQVAPYEYRGWAVDVVEALVTENALRQPQEPKLIRSFCANPCTPVELDAAEYAKFQRSIVWSK
jgi:hypothetical protein